MVTVKQNIYLKVDKMRKIEREMLVAIENQVMNWRHDNTMVAYKPTDNVSKIYLHGHLIAIYSHNDKTVAANASILAEYPTRTTKSRLRALGVNVYTKKSIVYLDDKAL